MSQKKFENGLLSAFMFWFILCLVFKPITVCGDQVTPTEVADENNTAPWEQIAEKIEFHGIIAAIYQYQFLSGSSDSDEGDIAFVFQPEITFLPTDMDEIFVKFGFAADNALNDKTPFNLAPWSADLEDDVRDINGRTRDYLLTAWYKHTFEFDGGHTLALTGGLIDSADYLDENNYANDEFAQFMNESLVNGPTGFFPSYDFGGAVEWDSGPWSARGVVMHIGENDDGNEYTYFGAQLGYTIQTDLGEGTYRAIVSHATSDFLDSAGVDEEMRLGLMFSADQELGDILGAWIRFGFQDDSAAITYDHLYSGGINISGKFWGREQDDIGIGFAHLHGGNLDLDKSNVFEAYARFGLTEMVALTLDAQYLDDDYNFGTGEDVDGWILGMRMVVEF